MTILINKPLPFEAIETVRIFALLSVSPVY